jgi:hypothetical protein
VAVRPARYMTRSQLVTAPHYMSRLRADQHAGATCAKPRAVAGDAGSDTGKYLDSLGKRLWGAEMAPPT